MKIGISLLTIGSIMGCASFFVGPFSGVALAIAAIFMLPLGTMFAICRI